MKTKIGIFAILLAGGLINSHAQDTWTRKADFGGGTRGYAIGFTIGSKGYLGTGNNFADHDDFWEYDPIANVWTQKANFGGGLTSSGVGFSAGDKGYVVPGGRNDFWQFDPVANTWTQKADFAGLARIWTVGFSIGSNGYVGTGTIGSPYLGLDDFWEYDPATNTWAQKANFGGTARHSATGFSIGSKGYIGTGNDGIGYKRDFWEYDSAANSWTQKADFGGEARAYATGLSIDTKGYIGTGNGSNGSFLRDFWEYDPAINTWAQKADFGGTGRYYATGFSIDGKGYIGTGYTTSSFVKDFWEYIPATAQTAGTWTATGSMSIGRQAYFTATLLTNGKVLVAGGADSAGTIVSSAELYDSSTGTWTPTASMSTARGLHTATLLPDGKVLVVGGQNDTGAISSAELYDPGTGLWTLTGSMNVPRSAHMATLITGGPLSGMVIIAAGSSEGGGGSNNLVSAELYDPSTGLWTYTGSMTVARYFDSPSPTALPDGSVLIMGGTTCCPYHWLNEAELYDSVSQTWTPTSSKTTPANGRSVLLPDSKVLVAGGVQGTQPTARNVAAAELFDPTTGTWTATASMSTDRVLHTLTLLASGQALVAGGASGGWGVCNDVASAELYDSSAGTWLPTGNMTVARYYHTATLLPNGQVLAAGGADCEGSILSSAELYTPPSVAMLSTTSLKFGVQLVGTRSAAQTATLTNTGTTTLNISGIAASGDFLAENNCGSSLPAEASCTIRVAFNPSAKGARTGTVAITDDAADSPQIIRLKGTGTVVQISPLALDFGHQIVGTTSDPQTATITNISSEDLHIFGIALGGANFGDFAETTTCRSRLAAGGSCTIDVTFTPGARGHRHASLKIVDDGGASPQAVPLAGTGVPR